MIATQWLGAGLGSTSMTAQPAPIATTATRTTAATTSGFVAPGHSFTLYTFSCYPFHSCYSFVFKQGERPAGKFFEACPMPTKENILTHTDDFIKWFLPKLEKFPRNYKFLIGDRLVQLQLDLLEHLIEAYYQKEKLAKLRAANVDLEKLRHLLQISTEMRFISLDQLEYATRSLNQIGTQLGGWIRQQEVAR